MIDMTMDAIRKKPINPDSFVLLSARDLVAETMKNYAYENTEQSQKVSVQGEDFKLLAEPATVKYVLYNLIQNALFYIKTLPDTEITISLISDTSGVGRIEVRDTGPGIAPDALPKLFDSFYTSEKQGGTGLGLSYCKRTMTALGGDIQCHSELGQYTAFTLSFPKVLVQQTISQKAPEINKLTNAVSLTRKTVLVAEDDRMSRTIIKAILDRQGVHCLEAENGQVALDLLSTHHCDLIITDMQMPVMNGLELIKTIRERERKARGTQMPIFVLSAEKSDMVNAAMQLGVSDYFIKSASVERLVPKLRRLLAS